MIETPRYLRFARSLALTAGVAVASGCGSSAFPRTTDAGVPADAGTLTCDDCRCATPGGDASADAGVATCESIPALQDCCAVVGPLPPPDLAV